MNVIFTCGGTGGHINPAIAVAKLLQERRPKANILFVGADDGMETRLVPKEGFAIQTLPMSGFSRKLTPAGLVHNLKTGRNILKARRMADRIIADFRPDVIIGTGGYASYPMLRQGAKRGIPTAVHEANAVPGLATRMVEKSASRILVAFEESRGQYQNQDRVVAVGMPVQEAFFYTKKQDARQRLGLGSKPLVVSAWGSQGAREMNKKIADFIALECADGQPFYHVHATGSFGWRWMPDLVKEKGVDLSKFPDVKMQEYIYNMPELMAAADLVIGRAGSSTLNEIAASGTPCIIVPSPNVTDHHQEKNAKILADRGAAVVLQESECTGEVLYQTATRLLQNPQRLTEMSQALHQLAVVDCCERILQVIFDLAKQRK